MAKAIRTRGRMNLDEEKCIQNNLEEIERTVEANEIVTHLFSSDIISLDDKMEITSAEPRQKRIRLLIDKIILQGGRKAFTEFIRSLEKSHYLELVEKLNGPNRSTLRGEDDVDDTKKWKTGKNFEVRLDLLTERIFNLDEKVSHIDDLKIDIAIIKRSLKDLKVLTAKEAETKMTIEMLTQQLNEKTKKLEEAERQIDLLESKIQELEEQRKKDKMEINTLKGAMTRQDFTINTLKNKIGQQNDQMKELEKKDVDKENRLKKLEKMMLNQQRNQFKQKLPVKMKSKNRFEN